MKMLDLCSPTLYARNFKIAILKACSPRVAHLTPIEKLTQWVYYLRPLPGPNTHKQYLFQLEWYNQTNAQINTRSQHMLVTLLLWRSPNHLRLQSVKGTQVCAKEPSFKSSSNFSFCSSILQFINSSILHSYFVHPCHTPSSCWDSSCLFKLFTIPAIMASLACNNFLHHVVKAVDMPRETTQSTLSLVMTERALISLLQMKKFQCITLSFYLYMIELS